MERSEPRIIARGEWEQNEFGDLSYIPRHKAPPMGDARGNIGPWQEGRDPDDLPVDEYAPGAPTDPAVAAAMAELMAERDAASARQGRDGAGTGAGAGAGSRGGYASVSQEMWKAAGEDYLAGDTAETVGARYGMGVSTFRARARKAGWLRRDQPDPDPVDGPLDAADRLDEPADFAVMADQALARLNRAVRSGRAMEAARWMRLYLSLAALARQQDAAPPPPQPEPPDRIDRAAAVAREIGVIAREAAALTRGDIPGRDALMARVDALDDLSPPPISDELHYSDGVFAQGGSETGPPVPQIVIPEPSEAKTPEPRTAPPP